jgi:hypothetical protein
VSVSALWCALPHPPPPPPHHTPPPPPSSPPPPPPAGILPAQEDFATDLQGWGLLPGALNGNLAVWEADATANLAAWPSEFAEVAAEAACDAAGGAGEAGPLQQAAAAAALAAGLVPQGATGGHQPPGRGSSSWVKMAAAAADNVRGSHAQLSGASGAAAALTNALLRQWQMHGSWRASRVALAGALSLQRCGLDLAVLPGFNDTLQQQQQQQQHAGGGLRGYSSGPLVSGSWLPLDACGLPVGAAATGYFPDAGSYVSSAAAGSRLVLPPGQDVRYKHGSAGGSKAAGAAAAGAAGALAGCRSSSSRLPLCGWDLVRAVGGAADPVAACLKSRTGPRALLELSSLVLELSVSGNVNFLEDQGVGGCLAGC